MIAKSGLGAEGVDAPSFYYSGRELAMIAGEQDGRRVRLLVVSIPPRPSASALLRQ